MELRCACSGGRAKAWGWAGVAVGFAVATVVTILFAAPPPAPPAVVVVFRVAYSISGAKASGTEL